MIRYTVKKRKKEREKEREREKEQVKCLQNTSLFKFHNTCKCKLEKSKIHVHERLLIAIIRSSKAESITNYTFE